jgi:hypothetical protein
MIPDQPDRTPNADKEGKTGTGSNYLMFINNILDEVILCHYLL